jgi:hypothetical protein
MVSGHPWTVTTFKKRTCLNFLWWFALAENENETWTAWREK